MASLNLCQFIGNLGADPEIKSFQNGGRICNLRLACTEKWKDKTSGEAKERTEWISVTVNGDGLIGVAERYLKKGSKVYVSGKWQTRKWQDQSGNDRYSTELIVGFDGKIVMLDGPSGDRSSSGQSSSSTTGNGGSSGKTFNDGFEDDEIPFVSNDIAHERRLS